MTTTDPPGSIRYPECSPTVRRRCHEEQDESAPMCAIKQPSKP